MTKRSVLSSIALLLTLTGGLVTPPGAEGAPSDSPTPAAKPVATITCQYKDADDREVLSAIAEAGALNLVIDPATDHERMDITLTEVPVKIALDAVCRVLGLVCQPISVENRVFLIKSLKREREHAKLRANVNQARRKRKHVNADMRPGPWGPARHQGCDPALGNPGADEDSNG